MPGINRRTVVDTKQSVIAESFFNPVIESEEEITQIFVRNLTSQLFSREVQKTIRRRYKRYKKKHQKNGECLKIEQETITAIGLILYVRTEDLLGWIDMIEPIIEIWAGSINNN